MGLAKSNNCLPKAGFLEVININAQKSVNSVDKIS
jgi:hypothetical protein